MMPVLMVIGLWAIVLGIAGCASREAQYWADLSKVVGQVTSEPATPAERRAD